MDYHLLKTGQEEEKKKMENPTGFSDQAAQEFKAFQENKGGQNEKLPIYQDPNDQFKGLSSNQIMKPSEGKEKENDPKNQKGMPNFNDTWA